MLAPDPTLTQRPAAPLTKKPVVGNQPPAAPPPAGAPAAPPVAPAGGSDYSQFLTAISKPPDTSGLMRQAHTQALADTGTLVAGIRQQQQQINADAAARAREISAASLGGAKYLQSLGLGDKLAAGLTQAAGDQSSLAAGFSGQLQQTVGAASAKVQSALDQIGGGAVPSTAAAAGNTVYGSGGLLPANAMLAAAPNAQAQADAAPGQLTAYGQQEAVGAIGAGKQQADRLNTSITTAQGKLPALEQKYAAQLTTAAEKSRQDNISNVFKVMAVDQKHSDAEATRTWRQAQLDARAADRKAIADAKAATADALAAYRQGQLSISQFNAETTRINSQLAAAKLTLPDATLSRARGILVDASGQPVTSKDGQPIVLPGNKIGPDGNVIKTSTAKAGGSFSSSLIGDTAAAISGWKTGKTGTQNGVPVVDTASQRTYSGALTSALARGPDTPEWRKKATELVNAEYGSPRKIAVEKVSSAKAQGLGMTDALKALLTSQKRDLPVQDYLPALAKVYGYSLEDVRATLVQLQQLVASGQIGG